MTQYSEHVKRRGFIVAFGSAATATACSCVTDSSDWPFPKEDGNAILFRGTVTSRKALPRPNRYAATFNAHEYWRGIVPATISIEVQTSIGGGDCMQDGPGYLAGEEYLVYAYKPRSEPNAPYHNIAACVPVGPVKDLPKVVKALGPGRKPAV
jgi:hypothetical protein